MENTEYDENELQFMDDVSEYSGDSILIGVEDQTEFNDYKEKVDEAEMDMELYNKMWGKRRGWMTTTQIRRQKKGTERRRRKLAELTFISEIKWKDYLLLYLANKYTL